MSCAKATLRSSNIFGEDNVHLSYPNLSRGDSFGRRKPGKKGGNWCGAVTVSAMTLIRLPTPYRCFRLPFPAAHAPPRRAGTHQSITHSGLSACTSTNRSFDYSTAKLFNNLLQPLLFGEWHRRKHHHNAGHRVDPLLMDSKL